MTKDAKDFTKALEDLRREIRTELRGLKESVNYCSNSCDDLKKVADDIKELRREVETLTKNNKNLETENRKLTSRLEEIEQYQRANNLEIKGAPEVGDPVMIVKQIAEILGEPITDADIDICHRVPTQKPTEKNIIVRFVQRSKRNSLLQKCKKKRMTTSDLGAAGAASPVYVNEHLTRQSKQNLGAAIARKRVVGWKFVWSSGGRVYARKNETSPIIRIADLDDVEKMTG